ncbi:hypothetical protein PG994_013504 [Apiospora phragmitis]|uniref:Uncharacterized protein n=1 Tax=Apiospora phragmitis TaxID=2905665 RepID=A0ABR1T8T5_9PEZI
MAAYTYNSSYNTRGSCSPNNHTKNNNNQRQWQSKRPQTHWEAGHLAFLTSCERYNNEDYHNLIKSKEIPHKATNHPCVILQRLKDSDHCLITPVSAFSASEETNFLPPWKQSCHRYKKVEDFRSFRGSESSSSSSGSDSDSNNDKSCQILELRNGRTMPKPKASWIYIQRIYVVPVHLLIPFKKPGRGEREPQEPRQLTGASLATLRAHIQQKCTVFQKQINKLNQFRRGSQQASSRCNKPDQPQQCSSSASQFHREVNQAYKALNLDGANDQTKTSSKPTANSNANATTTTSPKTMSSTTSSPTQGPWRKLQTAPVSPTAPKNTPTKKGPNQLQKTPQPLQIVNGTQWRGKA